MLRREKTLALILSLSLPSIATATSITGELGFYYGNQNINGWIETIGDGDKVDLEEDLNFDNKGSYFINLKLRHGLNTKFIPNFYFQYTRLNFEKGGNLRRNIKYAGKNISAGAINSKFQFDHYDFIFAVRTLSSPKFQMDMGLALRYIDFDSKISSSTTTAQKDEKIYIPMLYMLINLQPSDFVSFIFEEKMISYKDNNVSDLNVEIRFKLKNFGMFAPYVSMGYRYEVFSLDDVKNLKSTITINQPYLGVGINF